MFNSYRPNRRQNMPRRFNSPTVPGGENVRRRWVHSPITIEHRGVNASITEDGKVIFKSAGEPVMVDGKPTNEIEYDEVEVSANLIFKVAELLHATRKVVFIDESQPQTGNSVATK